MGLVGEEVRGRDGKQKNERGGGQKEKETKREGRKRRKVDQKDNRWGRQAGWDEGSKGGDEKRKMKRQDKTGQRSH